MIEVQFKYFGAFRNFEEKNQISYLSFDHPPNISELKVALANEFRKKIGNASVDALIQDSAVATGEDILSLKYRVEQSCTLMLLPPVCGG